MRNATLAVLSTALFLGCASGERPRAGCQAQDAAGCRNTPLPDERLCDGGVFSNGGCTADELEWAASRGFGCQTCQRNGETVNLSSGPMFPDEPFVVSFAGEAYDAEACGCRELHLSKNGTILLLRDLRYCGGTLTFRAGEDLVSCSGCWAGPVPPSCE